MTLKHIRSIIVSAALYFILDLPVRITGFAHMGNICGLKSFLPLTLGLLLGPASVPGMCLGCLLSSAAAESTATEIISELFGIIMMGIPVWFLWYAKNSQPIHLKKAADYIRFILITAVLSSAACLPVLAIQGSYEYQKSALCILIISIFVGIPVLILATSVLCISPICPPWVSTKPDLSGTIGPSAKGLEEINDRISEIYTEKGFSRKLSFMTQSCIEEFAVRIQAGCGNCPIDFNLYISDSVSMTISYPGNRFNPLRPRKEETDEDLLGLVLIRRRALRAAFGYTGNTNRLHIVI